MVLGGLEDGVTPLGWTYAYSTIGNNGDRVSGTLAPRPGDSPVSYTQVTDRDGHTIKDGDNDSIHTQVIPEGVAEEAKSILETVVSSGTGTNAQIGASGQWGKTGTTENNGDAWFCGGVEDEVTACVWVGYADTTTPMTTLYNGGPVMGGTYPALIWARVISAWEEIKAERAAEAKEKKASKGDSGSGSSSEESTYAAPEASEENESAPEPETSEPAPEEEAPEAAEPAEPAEPAPAEPAAPSSGGGVTAG
jgi:penicillin-binding protein 1A